ncbi:MAG: serine/threonine-protein kinase [Kofleriaceae bacterium]|nr:serine/threonine-protein kinase [Kofleriaceae bacterium]
MTTGECPSEDQLVRMVEGALSSDSLTGIEAHINTCELCMSVVAGLGALNEPPKARTVERYQLDRKIGGGGMGEVWAAWDPKLRREVAVKLVRPDRADDGKERARLLREAQALARLTHPNVVAVHDVGEIDGEVFIATELVTGDTLATRGGASVDWKVIVGLYAQAARGLAAAHAAGLVHRDVKPSNLLLGVDGRVRVADFGLAVRADSNRVHVSPEGPTETPSIASSGLSITAAGHIAGTPAYMAPEQRAGDPPEAPADQFALCVALGEAIAGRRPPVATTREEMIAFVAERRPREPGLDELCAIIARGTSLLPAERFPDMATLAGLLEDLAGTRAAAATASPKVEVREQPPTERPSERARTTSRMRIGIAVAALATVGGATAFFLRDKSDKHAAPLAANPIDETGSAVAGSGSTNSGSASSGSSSSASSANAGSASNANSGSASDAGPTTTQPPEPPSKTVRRAPPRRVAIPDDPPGDTDAPDAGSGNATTPTPASSTATLKDVQAAIQRRDGKACRAALAQLTSPPPSDFRVASAHSVCEMVAGNCEGGLRAQRALLAREGSPPDSAEITADLYCPVTNDPVVRLRRLKQQISMFARTMDCNTYLPHVRASAKVASSDQDKSLVGSLLREVAYCFSVREECKTARTVLAEAQVFNPRLELNELSPACR